MSSVKPPKIHQIIVKLTLFIELGTQRKRRIYFCNLSKLVTSSLNQDSSEYLADCVRTVVEKYPPQVRGISDHDQCDSLFHHERVSGSSLVVPFTPEIEGTNHLLVVTLAVRTQPQEEGEERKDSPEESY